MEDKFTVNFPNKYIRKDALKKYGINHKFHIVYVLISLYRSSENYSWITIKEVFDFCGYDEPSRKNKSFNDVLDTLKYMEQHGMIKVYCDLQEVSYTTGIKMRIIPEYFDVATDYTKFSIKHLRSIAIANESINKESLLIAFLYASSLICSGGDSKPAVFFKNMSNVAKDLGIRKQTAQELFFYMSDFKHNPKPLLVKDKIQIGRHSTYIYALNQPGYEREIELAQKTLKFTE